MKFVEDNGGAIALMIVALVFLGTWPALLNLLERRGRNPVHTYLDYSLTNFLVAVIIAFTLGQIGAPKPGVPNFTTQLGQVNDQAWRHSCCTASIVLRVCNLVSHHHSSGIKESPRPSARRAWLVFKR